MKILEAEKKRLCKQKRKIKTELFASLRQGIVSNEQRFVEKEETTKPS